MKMMERKAYTVFNEMEFDETGFGEKGRHQTHRGSTGPAEPLLRT